MLEYKVPQMVSTGNPMLPRENGRTRSKTFLGEDSCDRITRAPQ